MEIGFDNDKILVVKGIDFDKVSTLGGVCSRFTGSNIPQVIRGWNLVATTSRNIYRSPDQEGRAFACTICNDLRYNGVARCKGARPYSAESVSSDDDDDVDFAALG